MTKAYENVEAEKMDAEMLWSRVEEVVRYRELGKQLYKIAPWSGKPCLQFDIEMPGSGVCLVFCSHCHHHCHCYFNYHCHDHSYN